MTQALYLSLGSNLGDRQSNLRAAVEALRREMTVSVVSSVYETEPVGVVDQPPFLNIALAAATDLPATKVLSLVKGIERAVGRTPTFRWGPRVVDIDILMYGDLVLESVDLVVPHPEMVNRAFVLVPLAEVAAAAVHPIAGVSVAELLERVAGGDSVHLVGTL